jgi:uncharacterized protein
MANSKVILVTGASSGIGEAAARLLAAEGYRVALAARRRERLAALADQISADGGTALVVPTDLSILEQARAMVETVIRDLGQVDVLFNNAGFGRMNWLDELDPEKDVSGQVQVNLLGLIGASQAVLPHMISRRSGHIINMASLSSFIGTPTYSIYSATKFGVRGFTEALRREVAQNGIRVSGIYPGGVATEFASKMGPSIEGRMTTPGWLRLSSEDVARAVLKLVQRPKSTVILPWLMAPAIWVNSLFPSLADFLITRSFRRQDEI